MSLALMASVAGGVVGMLTTSVRRPSEALPRAGLLVLAAVPFATAALTFLLRAACPFYVTGPGSGYCDYQQVDLLGGWVSGVVMAFGFRRAVRGGGVVALGPAGGARMIAG